MSTPSNSDLPSSADTSGYLDMDLLRFTTAGSVDDGKSTLIGRLLYDSKNTFDDQMEAVEESSKSRGDENVNLALLTDGLKAEREQGITIDVAYRYFATPKRTPICCTAAFADDTLIKELARISSISTFDLIVRILRNASGTADLRIFAMSGLS